MSVGAANAAVQIDWDLVPSATHYQPARDGGYNPVYWHFEGNDPVEAWAVLGDELRHVQSPFWVYDTFDPLIPRPAPAAAEWDGFGLPPVGTECEHEGTADDDKWQLVKIIAHTKAHGSAVAVFQYDDTVTYSDAQFFRPVRTPEQIATEERAASVDAIERVMLRGQKLALTITQIAAAIHDAGFHKRPTP